MFSRGQADRVWVFQSPNEIEITTGFAISSAPVVQYGATGNTNLDGDVLTEYLNPGSDAFFASVPSADFELARSREAASCGQ